MEQRTRHGVRCVGLINKLLKCSNALAVRDLHSLGFEVRDGDSYSSASKLP